MEPCMSMTGESWKMSMILHGSFISLDDGLLGIYILFHWNFISFGGAL